MLKPGSLHTDHAPFQTVGTNIGFGHIHSDNIYI